MMIDLQRHLGYSADKAVTSVPAYLKRELIETVHDGLNVLYRTVCY